ncbi:hypothetical protein [Oryza sativa Japonica Group]|uniref:Uncharacterized protein n=2 Tax=Oryza sativa subsp. japonica TaxID=39947 RepID=Q658C9_ORYSJ|nr:hypothetical protein [Oryza sativa Japonica Group]BAD44870.1 hypothetical protein [Oryza sativa Japonica Group]
MGTPLAPIPLKLADPLPLLSIKGTLIQYMAASGGYQLLQPWAQRPRRRLRRAGRLRFVLWQMALNMWYVELAVGGSKVHAGSNSRLVWRHTPAAARAGEGKGRRRLRGGVRRRVTEVTARLARMRKRR